jgi:nitrate reductase NapE component
MLSSTMSRHDRRGAGRTKAKLAYVGLAVFLFAVAATAGVGGFDFGRDLAQRMNQPQIIIVTEAQK